MAARYDTVADTYAAGDPDDLSSPAAAALLDLLGPVGGEAAVDLACGHGLIARELARRGATVVGLDVSSGLLERARAAEVTEPLGVTYVLGDAADPHALDEVLGESTVAAIACNFGLSDIDDLGGAFDHVARRLRPGGRFVASLLHPCFAGAADVSGSWPTGASYREEGWWRADGARSTLRREVGATHRTVATYLNALVDHGLAIDRVAEPAPEPWWVEDRPGCAGQPVYLVFRCLLTDR